MNFWKLLNLISGIGMILLLGLILFVPLPTWASYGMPLLLTVIIIGVISILHSLYIFIQETPKRKWGEGKTVQKTMFLNMRWKTWKSIGEWTFLILVVIILWQYQKGAIGNKECPDLVRGNEKSDFILQYFYSPFCPACWQGEKITKDLIKKYPSIRFENFDSRYCMDIMMGENVHDSPAYNMKTGNSSQIVYVMENERIELALCDLGICNERKME